MILIDAGPLVALIDKNDAKHAVCVAAARQLGKEPLVTTWPCYAEAMFLVYKAGGYPAQEKLWQMRAAGRLILHLSSDAEGDRMRAMMAQYRDTPMDLGDASLVAAAESLSLDRVFTIDSHFHAYLTANGAALVVIP